MNWAAQRGPQRLKGLPRTKHSRLASCNGEREYLLSVPAVIRMEDRQQSTIKEGWYHDTFVPYECVFFVFSNVRTTNSFFRLTKFSVLMKICDGE